MHESHSFLTSARKALTGPMDPWTQIVLGETTVVLERPTARSVLIASLRTFERYKRQGSARRALEAVCQAADREGVTLVIWASPLTRKTNRGRLIAFYASVGFVLTGRSVNAAGDPEMVRLPNALKPRKRHSNECFHGEQDALLPN